MKKLFLLLSLLSITFFNSFKPAAERIAIKTLKHKKIQCPDCSKFYKSRYHLNIHYKVIHENKSDWMCPICNKACWSSFHLEGKHKNTHKVTEKPKKSSKKNKKKCIKDSKSPVVAPNPELDPANLLLPQDLWEVNWKEMEKLFPIK